MSENAKAAAIVIVAAVVLVIIFGRDIFGGEEADIRAAVAAELRDPSSAQFRDLKIGESLACGEVNGKNGFGSYSGFRDFVYADGVVIFEPEKPVGLNVQRQTEFYESQAKFFRFQRLCISH